MLITFIDIETTGLDPSVHEIIELAAIRTDIIDSKIHVLHDADFKVKPKKPVDPFVASINHYDEKVWEKDSVEFYFALGSILNTMRGSTHAGSNPKFDESFLRKAVDEVHWSYPKLSSYHLIDVSVLALPLLLKGKIERIKQDVLATHFKLTPQNHTAMGDANQCMEIFANLNELEIVISEDAIKKAVK
jgi:DNA polymerase III subunit alpha, Gram-positive type